MHLKHFKFNLNLKLTTYTYFYDIIKSQFFFFFWTIQDNVAFLPLIRILPDVI